MTDRAKEFMDACNRTPAQVYEEYANELRTNKELLDETEKDIARKIDDYLYKALEPYAVALIKSSCGHIMVYTSKHNWYVPVDTSREKYDKQGGIKNSIYETKCATLLISDWPEIKAAFHNQLDEKLAWIASKMKSEAAKVAEREKVIENFKI